MSGIELIKEERDEQISKHGYTIESDSKTNDGYQLIDAVSALITCIPDGFQKTYLIEVHGDYPPIGWETSRWKKMLSKSYKDRLVIAGALIAAEIDRIEKLESKENGG